MKKLIKIAAIVVLALFLIVGITVGVVLYNIDSLAKRAVEEGGSSALGVTTKVESVSLHIFSGDVGLSGLEVANPSGFSGPHFLALKKCQASVTLDSLNKDVVEVPKLSLSGIDVSLERSSAGSNYGKIIENISKLKGPTPQAGGPEKKFIIHELTIENISIHADILGAPGQIGQIVNGAAKVNVPIERIELKDVGKTGSGVGGTGVTMKELSSIVVQAVLAAAADKGYGTIPGEILNDLKNAVTSFDGLKNLPVAVIGRAGETVTMLGGTVEKIGEGAGKAINDVGKGVTDAIGGLLGGKKDEKKDPPKKP